MSHRRESRRIFFEQCWEFPANPLLRKHPGIDSALRGRALAARDFLNAGLSAAGCYRLVFGPLTNNQEMAPENAHHSFRCPNLGCKAEYVALAKDCAPDEKPRCIDCGTPFLAKHDGRFLHYQSLRFD